MRRKHFFAVLSGIVAVALLAADASATYHPTLGRWMQRDPVGYADSMGLYDYVGNSPADSADALGLLPYYPGGRGGYLSSRGWILGEDITQGLGNFLDAQLTDSLYWLIGESDLPPMQSGDALARSRDYCCQCVPVARAQKAFAESMRRGYANASGATRVEVDKQAAGNRRLETVGWAHPVKGAHVDYPVGEPCADLIYQARAEHERSHMEDIEKLKSEARSGKTGFTSTWNSVGCQKQSETTAYGVQSGVYQEFIDACVRKYPEVSF